MYPPPLICSRLQIKGGVHHLQIFGRDVDLTFSENLPGCLPVASLKAFKGLSKAFKAPQSNLTKAPPEQLEINKFSFEPEVLEGPHKGNRCNTNQIKRNRGKTTSGPDYCKNVPLGYP